jgi:hypothetical protein
MILTQWLPYFTVEIRNPKAEARKKAEIRRPKKGPEPSGFGLRISDLDRELELLLEMPSGLAWVSG